MSEEQLLYQHFQDQDQELIEKILDLIERVETYYSPQLTDFLDPYQLSIARSLLGRAGVTYFVSSDGTGLEYGRILMAPDYYVFDWDDFDISLVDISYAQQFNQLSHRQILGSLLNGLGLKRQVIGDILVGKGHAQVVLARHITEFIITNTQKMARAGVRLTEIPFTQLMVPEEEERERLLILSSLRLDKLVAAVTNQSRSQAQSAIKLAKVKVNYREAQKGTQMLSPGDLVSVRGYGRFMVKDLLGLTKSGKQKVLIVETLMR